MNEDLIGLLKEWRSRGAGSKTGEESFAWRAAADELEKVLVWNSVIEGKV